MLKRIPGSQVASSLEGTFLLFLVLICNPLVKPWFYCKNVINSDKAFPSFFVPKIRWDDDEGVARAVYRLVSQSRR